MTPVAEAIRLTLSAMRDSIIIIQGTCRMNSRGDFCRDDDAQEALRRRADTMTRLRQLDG